MKVIAVPTTNFVHGTYDAIEGRPMEMDESIAKELEIASLVRIRKQPPAVNLSADPGKARDDGQGQPSSFSPEAPVLAATDTQMSRQFASGANRIPRRGR